MSTSHHHPFPFFLLLEQCLRVTAQGLVRLDRECPALAELLTQQVEVRTWKSLFPAAYWLGPTLKTVALRNFHRISELLHSSPTIQRGSSHSVLLPFTFQLPLDPQEMPYALLPPVFMGKMPWSPPLIYRSPFLSDWLIFHFLWICPVPISQNKDLLS